MKKPGAKAFTRTPVCEKWTASHFVTVADRGFGSRIGGHLGERLKGAHTHAGFE